MRKLFITLLITTLANVITPDVLADLNLSLPKNNYGFIEIELGGFIHNGCFSAVTCERRDGRVPTWVAAGWAWEWEKVVAELAVKHRSNIDTPPPELSAEYYTFKLRYKF